MSYNYSYPHPALTVDAIVFTFSGKALNLLLIQRAREPFKNTWAFPGGFVDENETVEEAIVREVREEVSLSVDNLQQFYIASTPGRDPRGWTVSVVFIGYVEWDNRYAKAGDDAASAKWFPLCDIPILAFDHEAILSRARIFLKKLVRQSVISKKLLPNTFHLKQLHSLYYEISGSTEETDLLIRRLIEKSVIVKNASCDLHHFNPANYDKVLNMGFH